MLSPILVLGQIVRLFNSSSTAQTYNYTSTSNIQTTVSLSSSGSIGNPTYILIASGSVLGADTSFPFTEYKDSYFDFTKKILVKNLLITGSQVGNSFTEVLFTTPGSGSWTKPAGVTQVVVECLSGGGGGGGATIANSGGGGGAGGQYSKKLIIYPSAQQSIPYVVGAAGVGSTGNGTSGSNTTWNSTQVVAVGGAGGLANQNLDLNPQGGGIAASTNQATGDVIYNGQNGSGGYYDPVGAAGAAGAFGGGGGSAAGAIGEAAGTEPFDLGGGGGLSQFAASGGVIGDAATLYDPYGGGGGGAARVSGPGRAGGNGAPGIIRVIYR